MKLKFTLLIILIQGILFFSLKAQQNIGKMRQAPDVKLNQIDSNKTFNRTINTTAVKSNTPGSFSMRTLTDNPDVRIFPSANPQAEVHISINRSNPNILLASANTYTNKYTQGYYYSTNAGSTWNGSDALQNDPGNLEGDPSTAIGADGTMFISSINASGGYYLQNSINNGQSFSALRASATAETGFDKEMIAVDDEIGSPFANNFYCAWTNFASQLQTQVEFNRSTDHGVTFSSPTVLSGNTGQGTNVQTGPNGEVYVCWADYDYNKTSASGLGFASSTNGGASFGPYSRVFSYNGIRTTNGPNPTFNNIRVNDFPSMSVDKSSSNTRGRIYVTFAANDANGKGVIQVNSSSNGGASWTSPVTVSIPNASQCFFPWIAVDDCSGDILVVYYAFDNSSIAFSTNTYVAHSSDGGVTWENQIVSDVPHITSAINNGLFAAGYQGDYIGIAAFGGKAYPTWMDNRNGTWQLYVSPISYYQNNGTSTFSISGDDLFCNTSNTYTVANLPNNYNIAWSLNHSGIASLNVSGNQASLTRITNGDVNLIATITSPCGQTIQVQKSIYVGKPNIGGTYNYNNADYPLQYAAYGYNPVCNLITAHTNMQISGSNSVTWHKVSSSGVVNYSPSGNDISFYLYYVGETALFQIDASNGCGTTSNQFSWQSIDCGGGGGGCSVANYIISPNPAVNTGTILILPGIPAPCPGANPFLSGASQINNTNAVTLNNDLSIIKRVRIFDDLGRLRKDLKFSNNNKQASIDVRSLNKGVYYIEISNNQGIQKVQSLILGK